MADKDVEQAIQLEDGSYLTVEDGTCLCAGLALDVDTLVVELHPTKSLDAVLPVVAGDEVRTRDGHGQLATVADKGARQFAVGLAHVEPLQRSSFRLGVRRAAFSPL